MKKGNEIFMIVWVAQLYFQYTQICTLL